MTSALHVPGARAALRRQRKSPNPSACHGNWNEQHSQPGAEAHSSVAERDWGCASSQERGHESHPKLSPAGRGFSNRVEHKGLRARKIFFHPRNSWLKRENKTAPISLHRNEARGFQHRCPGKGGDRAGDLRGQMSSSSLGTAGIVGHVLQENSRIHHLLPSSCRASLGTACSRSHQPSQQDIFPLGEIHCHCAHSQADLTFPNNSCSCSAQTILSRAGAEAALSTLFGHGAQSILNPQEAGRAARTSSSAGYKDKSSENTGGAVKPSNSSVPSTHSLICLIITTQGGQTDHRFVWIGTISPNWQLMPAGCAILHG